MKRLLFLGALSVTMIALFSVMMNPETTMADRPSPSKQQQSFRWTHTVDSVTNGTEIDTFETPTNSITKLMNFTDADRYGSVTGWYVIEYMAVDTGTAGVDVDTTKDSVWVEFFTSDVSGTPYKIIYSAVTSAIHVTASVVNSDYVLFTLSDSTLLDNTYMRIRSILLDSTDIKAELSAGIDYKITVKQYGK